MKMKPGQKVLLRELTKIATRNDHCKQSLIQLHIRNNSSSTSKNNNKFSYATCPHLVDAVNGEQPAPIQNSAAAANLENARPYSEVPGPKPLPILGNTWR